MFWSDKVALELQKRKLPIEWVDDMKTPSGRVHVGSLFGVVFHDLVHKSLKDLGVNTKYTYVFENHDPMDDIPSYLSREKYEKYLGVPLFKIPSPVEGFKDFAEYYALEFKAAFNALGSYPEIIWTKDLYTSGKMNAGIKTILDNAEKIRDIYREMYKKEIASDWYPFQVYCEQCDKVSTTRVYKWDGEFVYYTCPVDATNWTKGCGYEGKTSPFSDEKGMKGKMPWKVEWPAKWQAIGVTVEGAGKDHMSRGGSHDLATLVCERVLHYPVPYPVSYEFMLIGGKKMSSSKGRGFSASDILTILPPELARFLIVKMDIKQQTNFDPSEKNTIPSLFDEYQKAADAYFKINSHPELVSGSLKNNEKMPKQVRHDNIDVNTKSEDDLARVFEMAQVGEVKKPPTIRFSVLAQWVQMPNMQERIIAEGLEQWAKYARVWVEQYAPESDKFMVQEKLPEQVKNLTQKQKELLKKIADDLGKESDAEKLQIAIYEVGKAVGLTGKETFAAIYTALLGKDHGPKAAWLLLSLDKAFVKKRFEEAASQTLKDSEHDLKETLPLLNRPEIFSIHSTVKKNYPTMSVGIAVIEGITIQKTDPELEKEKEELLISLESLTTEALGEFPEIKTYRKLYKEMGIDWHSRRPSPEALLRRVALKKGLYTINTCVDAYNLVVMKHRISVGAFDMDKIQFPTELRFAKEGDEILLLGDSEATKYKPSELAYFDQQGGYNIDFNFRDSQRTAVTMDTQNVFINTEGLYDISPQDVEKVLNESVEKIIKYCGGKLRFSGIETSDDK